MNADPLDSNLDYAAACRALGYGYTVPTTPNGEKWLTECVRDLLLQGGPDALNSPRAESIREIFGGNLGPRPTQKSPRPKKDDSS